MSKRLIHTSGLDNFQNLLDTRLNDIAVEEDFPIAMYENWAIDTGVMQQPPKGWVNLYRDTKNWEAMYRDDDHIGFARFQMSQGNIYVRVAGTTEEICQRFVQKIKGKIKQIESKEGSINLRFWTNGQRGPTSVTRRIEAPEWTEIQDNYHASVRDKMTHLVKEFTPAHGGQLLLWHGPPGTGKTYALRSLVREWAKWCSAEYVVDPEVFFAHQPSYMMQVLLDSSVNSYPYLDDDEDEEGNVNQKWRLLIFEDTGELLSRDAGIRSGQGLSRLLNIVDGLIGQGLKVLILITTNEELGTLHEAVSRPGRAAVKAHFGALEAPEAVQWAERAGLTLPTVKQYTLAELYALREGFTEAKPERRQVGFAPLTAAQA